MLLAQAQFPGFAPVGVTYLPRDPEEYAWRLGHPRAGTGLWSGALFAKSTRRKAHWEATTVVAADIDSMPKAPLSSRQREALHDAMRGSFATCGYTTPHGGRAVFCLERPVAHLPTAVAVAETLTERVRERIRALPELRGLDVDPASVLVTQTFRPPLDPGLLKLYESEPTPLPRHHAPTTHPDPHPDPHHALDALDHDPDHAPAALPPTLPPWSLKERIQAWKAAYPPCFPPVGVEVCPMCGSTRGWGRLGREPARWVCFGAYHGQTRGKDGRVAGRPSDRAGGVFFGDLLDILRFQTGLSITMLTEGPPPRDSPGIRRP